MAHHEQSDVVVVITKAALCWNPDSRCLCVKYESPVCALVIHIRHLYRSCTWASTSYACSNQL